ncbi:MAG: hypothetical protein NUV69_02065 [Candidatus Curtissbacteria bacterium]|nr:hypothetical protein [Candidatus Curtissbacteria bacterium]
MDKVFAPLAEMVAENPDMNIGGFAYIMVTTPEIIRASNPHVDKFVDNGGVLVMLPITWWNLTKRAEIAKDIFVLSGGVSGQG